MSSNSEHARTREALDFLCQRFPKAFSYKRSEVRPLKPDIIEDIVSALGAEEFRMPMKRALAYYQARPHYLKKLSSGKWYRDLDGIRVELVPDDVKKSAAFKLKSIMERKGRES